MASGICFYSSGLIFHFPFSIAEASLFVFFSAAVYLLWHNFCTLS